MGSRTDWHLWGSWCIERGTRGAQPSYQVASYLAFIDDRVRGSQQSNPKPHKAPIPSIDGGSAPQRGPQAVVRFLVAPPGSVACRRSPRGGHKAAWRGGLRLLPLAAALSRNAVNFDRAAPPAEPPIENIDGPADRSRGRPGNGSKHSEPRQRPRTTNAKCPRIRKATSRSRPSVIRCLLVCARRPPLSCGGGSLVRWCERDSLSGGPGSLAG